MAVDDRVHAAGGVVLRPGSGGSEVLVVHRPKYDDWSLPKGKLEPGESHEAAACREVREETGVRVELGRELPNSDYVDRHDRPKTVRYWMMTPVAEESWVPNDEVDDKRWIPVPQAATLLTYEGDRRLLAELAGEDFGGTR
jgi:8-oxo-dGTP pyrophosphatase MutT (NUDIX family)